METLSNILQTQGYILLENVIDQRSIEYARSCMRDDVVDYTSLYKFIANKVLATVNTIMNGTTNDWDLSPIKYRVSDNNNSIDAGAFHRDILCIEEWYPALTCCCYLDETVMQVIPKSHMLLGESYWNAINIFTTRVNVRVKPGDILLFHSTMLHRGVFTKRQPHRRIIQIFDIFKNQELLKEHINKIVHIPGSEKYGKLMIEASKNRLSEPVINYFGYLNAITGYGRYSSKFRAMCKACTSKNIRMFSSEGLCERLVVKEATWQPINKYIILRNTIDMDTDKCKSLWSYVCYNQQYMAYIVILLSLLIVVSYLIIKALLLIMHSDKKKKSKIFR